MRHYVSIVVAALIIASVGGLTWTLQEAGACPGSDSALWRSQPTAETADGTGTFDTTVSPGTVELQLNWSFRETPFIGTAEINSSGNVNIATGTVVYTPSYFFPSSCEGSVGIEVSGDLSSGTTGTLKSHGQVWDSGSPPPYDDDIHTLSISS